jgi:8-oxo-dGTP pyrophosphatase MutT (NUDIX family)
MSETKDAKPRGLLPASTVLLLRDDAAKGLEVFMVQRHHQIDFASGALVFPGGKVEARDSDAAIRAASPGSAGLDDVELAFRVAAIREAFEECGVLLARPQGGAGLIDAARLAALDAAWRTRLVKNEAAMADMVAAERLDLAVELLVPFAHWITPTMMPKRFDTRFYLAVAPSDHLALHDGEESVNSVWITPADAIADGEAKRRTVIFPTMMQLVKLARCASASAALDAARAEPIVTVLPELVDTPDGQALRIPEEAGYGITQRLIKDGL